MISTGMMSHAHSRLREDDLRAAGEDPEQGGLQIATNRVPVIAERFSVVGHTDRAIDEARVVALGVGQRNHETSRRRKVAAH